ncbi:MAG: MerR family transcriptional regulator [Dehalococcoidia bacterium]|nr:MerR family transcriptional regulator [Dehalococcoidia bacterium]
MEFTSGLSREAIGGNGIPRRFAAKDLRLLSRVKELLAEADSTYGKVREQLEREGFFQQLRPVQVSAYVNDTHQPSSEEEKVAVERYVMGIFEKAMEGYLKRVEDLQQEIEDLKDEIDDMKDVSPSPGGGSAKLPWPLRLVF